MKIGVVSWDIQVKNLVSFSREPDQTVFFGAEKKIKIFVRHRYLRAF